VIKRIGSTVEYGDHIYKFGSEEDALGFVNCCNGSGGRPGSCAIEWRCINKKKKVNEKDAGLER